ncbi:cryptochrome/photolyase family protein [Pedobacter sp. MW01-1-1]|uniref:cryptochrome/photolyase family protein n=1 Tax=Pedobacter sp. MW01-1-1 TaxID=3383027 RepID=UPI003FF0884D
MISLVWLRRDLRLEDNTALFHALKGPNKVLPLFIFDTTILCELDKNDARLVFIHQTLFQLKKTLQALGSDILIKQGKPDQVFLSLLAEYPIRTVYTNSDYEPYARKRDERIHQLLKERDIALHSFKDHVIFDQNEIVKSDGSPYTVFTPYYKQWLAKLTAFYHKSYPTERYFGNFHQIAPSSLPSLQSIGFEDIEYSFPLICYQDKLENYAADRDFPAINGTTKIGLHLRFGTLSIRTAVSDARRLNADTWLKELAWRDFYSMIMWHFPHSAKASFKKQYDYIEWRNNEQEFEAWCKGNTGYPLVDAGMRQLNETGWMHNRVRMIVASFLTKHLLIDWRWGEAYFAEKLLDYDLASNVGGWQWAAGCGNDAAPYFRVFNPELQTKKFDPNFEYIKKWLPEYGTKKYAQPIVEHTFARERVLKVFKTALATP